MTFRILGLAFALAFPAASLLAATPEELAELRQAMALKQLVEIVSDEGIAQADDVQDGMLAGRGGSNWDRLVAGIYDVDTLYGVFQGAFDASLAERDVTVVIDFYAGELGPRIRDLELDSRRAIMSEDIEESAKEHFEKLRAEDAGRVALLDGFIEAGDLIERNVTGALNSNLAFYKGLLDGGSFEMSEGEILSEVWSQEAEIRSATEAWMYGYLALAYGPLSDAELSTYVEFTGAEPGQDLNRALFAGFDAVFLDVSYRMGRAVSTFMASQEL